MSFSVKKVSTITLTGASSDITWQNIPILSNTTGSYTGWWFEVELCGKINHTSGSQEWFEGEGINRYRHANVGLSSEVSQYYSYTWLRMQSGSNSGTSNALSTGGAWNVDRAQNRNGGGMIYDLPMNYTSYWGTVPYYSSYLRVGPFYAGGNTPGSLDRHSFSISGSGGQSSGSSSNSEWRTSSFNSANGSTPQANVNSFRLYANTWSGSASFNAGTTATLYMWHNNNSQT